MGQETDLQRLRWWLRQQEIAAHLAQLPKVRTIDPVKWFAVLDRALRLPPLPRDEDLGD
jgi:hypothetical protein